jgi:hypothetical protein
VGTYYSGTFEQGVLKVFRKWVCAALRILVFPSPAPALSALHTSALFRPHTGHIPDPSASRETCFTSFLGKSSGRIGLLHSAVSVAWQYCSLTVLYHPWCSLVLVDVNEQYISQLLVVQLPKGSQDDGKWLD